MHTWIVDSPTAVSARTPFTVVTICPYCEEAVTGTDGAVATHVALCSQRWRRAYGARDTSPAAPDVTVLLDAPSGTPDGSARRTPFPNLAGDE